MKDSIISPNVKKIIKWAAVLLFWLLVWEGLYRIVGRDIFIAAPKAVFLRLLELIQTLPFWQSILFSFLRIMAGYLLGLLFGAGLAVLCTKVRLFEALFAPLMTVIRATPVASFIMLTLVWMKSAHTVTFIAFLMVLPMVYEGVRQGIASVDGKLLEMAQVFGLPKKKVLSAIYLPSVLPYFGNAALTALGFAWKAGVAAEVLALPRLSIGKNLYDAKVYLLTVDLFAWTAVIILLSLLFEGLLKGVLRPGLKRREVRHD